MLVFYLIVGPTHVPSTANFRSYYGNVATSLPTVTCHPPILARKSHQTPTISARLRPNNTHTHQSLSFCQQSSPLLSSLMEDPSKVQHVNKASSEELLRKFADLDSKPEPKSVEKREAKARRRRKRARSENDRDNCESPTRNGSLVELKSLLPPRTRRSALLRQLGIGRQELRVREIVICRFLLKKIEKV